MVDLIKSGSATNDQIRRLKFESLRSASSTSHSFAPVHGKAVESDGNNWGGISSRRLMIGSPSTFNRVSSRLSSKEPQPPSRRRAICTSGDLPTDGREGAEQRRRRGRGGAEGEEGDEGEEG